MWKYTIGGFSMLQIFAQTYLRVFLISNSIYKNTKIPKSVPFINPIEAISTRIRKPIFYQLSKQGQKSLNTPHNSQIFFFFFNMLNTNFVVKPIVLFCFLGFFCSNNTFQYFYIFIIPLFMFLSIFFRTVNTKL